MKQFFVPLLIALGLFFAVPVLAEAAPMTYNAGVYTNVCGSATDASFYACSAACNPQSGSCSGPAVVRFVCDGRQTECGGRGPAPLTEEWGTNMSLGYPGCGKTVQLDVFDKFCRDANGTWICGEQTRQNGYMTWYSGDCNVSTPTPTKTQNPSFLTCKNETLSWERLQYELKLAGYPGPWNYNDSLAAYNRAACPATVVTPTPYVTVTPTPTAVITPTPVTNNQTVIQTPQIHCPSGYVEQIQGSTINCLQQVQNQSVIANGGSTGAITINVPGQSQEPKVVYAAASTAVRELPKTGLPIIAWGLGGLLPLGAGMKRFGDSKKRMNNPLTMWQTREYLKS